MNLLKVMERIEKEFFPTEITIHSLYSPKKIYGHMGILEGVLTFEINEDDTPDEVISKLHKKAEVISSLGVYMMDNGFDISHLVEHSDGFRRGEVFMDYDFKVYQWRNGEKIKIEKD
jgi:hypothetical protein